MAVSIFQRPCMAATRVLAAFCRPASARDGAQAKRCSTLARHVWDRRFGVHTGVGGARANNNGRVGSGLPDAVRRLTALPISRPRPLFVPSLGEGCVWVTMKQLARCLGVIAPAANACFACSCRVVCTGEMTLPAASYAVYTPLHAVSSTTEHCNSACWRLALRLSCPVCWRAQCRTYMRSVHTHAYAVCIHRYIHTIIHCFHPK